ncbi:MAG: hypothetical protein QOG63_2552 [Thermoleophilaceae bacterium]|jgi:hypothetical protein|nr:hypothetical protein [Thermoleophilaceae bacterium]
MLLLAGCGGDAGQGRAGTSARGTPTATSRPTAKEPLSAAATRLERALPHRNCKVLITLMLQSIQRQRAPDAPPTSEECAFIKLKARNELRGYHVTKVREFGPAGFSEGTGANARGGKTVSVLWLLDSDGSWKAAFEAVLRPQIDVAPALAERADFNARRAVDALETGNCPELWAVLNPGSRFVTTANGQRDSFCRTLVPTYADKSTAFAQIRADGAPVLETLGKVHDFYFYGLRLANGRYMDMVLFGQFGRLPRAQLKQHDNPTVIELNTVRQPR